MDKIEAIIEKITNKLIHNAARRKDSEYRSQESEYRSQESVEMPLMYASNNLLTSCNRD